MDKKKVVRVNFSDFTLPYLEYSKTNKKSYPRDKTSIRQLISYFGTHDLSEITPWLVEKYKTQRKKEVSAASVNRELACLKHLYTKAMEWGKASENPAKKVRLFKENNRRVRFLTQPEIRKLLNVCAPHLKPIVFTALSAGMRKSEILNLKWKDIDFDRKLIYVNETKNGERKEVHLSNSLTEILKNITKDGTEYVFGDGKDKPFRDVRSSFDTVLKKADIVDFRFHDLRHTFASHLVMQGVDLTTVKELLGHKDIKMTLCVTLTSHPTTRGERSRQLKA